MSSFSSKLTGWDNGLNQDYNRKLHKWFASRMDARHVLRQRYKEPTKNPHMETTTQLTLHKDGTIPINGEVFVFGSNLSGLHGAGAARMANQKFGALMGFGRGYYGHGPAHSYALPTKDMNIITRSLTSIQEDVDAFIQFVNDNPDKRFFITRVGCGLAGYFDYEIAPMFNKINKAQCSFPKQWAPYLTQ